MMDKEISTLYTRDTYLNKDLPHIFGQDIYEYDMHRAGLSITKEFKLLPESTISNIESNSKDKTEIAVKLGKIQRKNTDYKDGLKEGFIKARRLFFEANMLEDHNILSIKKDAIFTLVPCETRKFGFIEFTEKNRYSSFLSTNKYEFYYYDGKVDVKGLDDKKLYYHRDFIMKFIITYFRKMEEEGKDSTLKYLRLMIDKYKKRDLPPGYYRSFNSESSYKSKDGVLEYQDISSELLHEIDYSFNYNAIFIPFLIHTL